MAQDWSGDANSVYKIIGASNHSNENRADDDDGSSIMIQK